MARRKIVLVIVEGPSDDTALGIALRQLFDKNTVHIEIMHGDITADYSVRPEGIVAYLGDKVRSYASNNHFTRKDFQQVIHIVDMDGAYIPETSVIQDDSLEKVVYTLEEIRTQNSEEFVRRNQHKQEVLEKLNRLNKLWGSIPYRVYYMSRNLDHVLYDKIDSTDEEKECDAYAFAKKYKNDVVGFLHFISDSDFSIMEGYRESWEFIKKEHHSLERYSNLGLCFVDVCREREK